MTKYPYEPPEGYKFVELQNPFMIEAMKAAKEAYESGFNKSAPIGLVLEKDGKILVKTVAGSDYHKLYGCERRKLGIVNEEYEKCPGCSYKVHSEQKAVKIARENNIDIHGANAFLFGHFWYCDRCCETLRKNGVTNFYLLKDADILFDREKPTCKRLILLILNQN